MRLFFFLIGLLPAGVVMAQSNPRGRIVESIVPWLDSNAACWSGVEVQNLGNRDVSAEVETHKSSGALTPLVGQAGIPMHLSAGARVQYKLQPSEEISGAWVRVREMIPSPRFTPVLAVSGVTECVSADELHTTVRDVAWPTRNPFFSGDPNHVEDGFIGLINTSERPVRVSGCYSSNVLYSVPHDNRPTELAPVCSTTIEELVPPFGSRQFPASRGGNILFSLRAQGDAVVLQMLRPTGSTVKMYRVDSAITFGKEVSDPGTSVPAPAYH